MGGVGAAPRKSKAERHEKARANAARIMMRGIPEPPKNPVNFKN